MITWAIIGFIGAIIVTISMSEKALSVVAVLGCGLLFLLLLIILPKWLIPVILLGSYAYVMARDLAKMLNKRRASQQPARSQPDWVYRPPVNPSSNS